MAAFFNLLKPKPFRVEPRYWDPQKEKREARERRIKAELGIADGDFKVGISRGDFKKGISNGKWDTHKERRKSNMRLIVIVVLLVACLYFILK